jgi:hypothetical protein
MEGDGGGVVVQLVQIDVELADCVRHDGESERGDVRVEEAVEASADAVVVERGELRPGQPQEFRRVSRGPLADTIKGLARDQEVLDQDQEPGRGGNTRASVLKREMVAEELLEAEPPEYAVKNRQGGDAV